MKNKSMSLNMIVPVEEVKHEMENCISKGTTTRDESTSMRSMCKPQKRGYHLPDTYTMEELEAAEEPKIDWIVEGMFARGNSAILSAHEKSGKSYSCLALVCNVSVGEPYLGHFNSKACSLWYMSLEDTDWRNKKRIQKELKLNYNPKNIMFSQRIKPGPEALRIIRRTLDEKEIDFLIIDTAARVDDPSRAQNYLAESSWYENFQQIAVDYDICVLLITHVTKSGVSDSTNHFSTTRGMGGNTGIVDTLIQVRTEFKSPEAEMIITGRDVPSRAILLRNAHAEKNGGILWQYVCDIDSEMIGLTGSIKEVLMTIEESPLPIEEICSATGLQEKNVYKILCKLIKEGRVKKHPIPGQGNKRMYGALNSSNRTESTQD